MARRFLNGIDLAAQRAVNLADGTNPTDATTLQQMQAFVRGLSWKAAARAASTANVTLTAPGATIDGVTLVANDRVLLKNQTAPAENGLYLWTGAAAALTRTTDANTGALLSGAAASVTEGTVNADKVFTQNADAITLGTTAVNFVQLGGAAASYLAGGGLSLSGQTFAVVAGSGIIADGVSTRVDYSIVARKLSVSIGNGALTAITVAHNFGTRDVQVTVYDTATFDEVVPDVNHVDVNNVVVTFATAPAAGAFRVVVEG